MAIFRLVIKPSGVSIMTRLDTTVSIIKKEKMPEPMPKVIMLNTSPATIAPAPVLRASDWCFPSHCSTRVADVSLTRCEVW